jgi:hypothetical protein
VNFPQVSLRWGVNFPQVSLRWGANLTGQEESEGVEFWVGKQSNLQDFLGAIVDSRSKMSFNGLRLEYALEGNSNYIAWKDRMEAVLEDNVLKGYIDTDVPMPDAIDTENLDAWQKKVAKVRRILL